MPEQPLPSSAPTKPCIAQRAFHWQHPSSSPTSIRHNKGMGWTDRQAYKQMASQTPSADPPGCTPAAQILCPAGSTLLLHVTSGSLESVSWLCSLVAAGQPPWGSLSRRQSKQGQCFICSERHAQPELHPEVPCPPPPPHPGTCAPKPTCLPQPKCLSLQVLITDPWRAKARLKNELGDLWQPEETPKPCAGLALWLGLLPSPSALPAGDMQGAERQAEASARDEDVGGVGCVCRETLFSFQTGKTKTSRQVSKLLPRLGVQPAVYASPMCSPAGTGIPQGDHQRMLQYRSFEDSSLSSKRRAFPAASWKDSHVLPLPSII